MSRTSEAILKDAARAAMDAAGQVLDGSCCRIVVLIAMPGGDGVVVHNGAPRDDLVAMGEQLVEGAKDGEFDA